MQAGDLLLYAAASNWGDRIIAAATHGPYVHVEIAVDDRMSIGATGRGIVRHAAPSPAAVIPTGAQLNDTYKAIALKWLDRQVGDRYGWLDIAVDALRAILPSPTPFLVAPSTYDCSHLAVQFLELSGYTLPDAWIAAPQCVSPNDIAHLFKAIK